MDRSHRPPTHPIIKFQVSNLQLNEPWLVRLHAYPNPTRRPAIETRWPPCQFDQRPLLEGVRGARVVRDGLDSAIVFEYAVIRDCSSLGALMTTPCSLPRTSSCPSESAVRMFFELNDVCGLIPGKSEVGL